MSNEIDWSKAPEGATHWVGGSEPWHKHIDGISWYWQEGGYKWRQLSIPAEQVEDEYRATIVERPPESWTGTGIPPVGTVCEVEAFHVGRGEWTVVEVLAHAKHDEDDALLVCEIDHDGDRAEMHGIIYRPHYFRPICTQAQIEEEEREKAIQQMVEDADYDGPTARGIYAKLYDEGYRK